MSQNFVYAVVALDHAFVWKNGLESGADPVHLKDSQDNPDYKKQHDSSEGHRDRSELDAKFAAHIAAELEGAETIYLVSAGSGKANSAHQLVEYLKEKHPKLAEKVLETGTADVNALSHNQLLELGRERKAKLAQGN